jgi:GNAT superfamily N-acetyltransferase
MINFSEIKVFEQLEFDRMFLIFELFDVTIGQISFEKVGNKKKHILISDFEVKEDLRGFGIGSFILQTCIEWLNKLELNLDYKASVNIYSRNIFLRNGFEVVSIFYNMNWTVTYENVIYKNYSHS